MDIYVMRHIRVFESFEGGYKIVNNHETGVDKFEAPTVKEVERLRQICGTLGFPSDEPAYTNRYERWHLCNIETNEYDKWWQREDPDHEVRKTITLTDDTHRHFICPCIAMSAANDLTDRYPNDSYEKGNEGLMIKFSKLSDDWWQVVLVFTNNIRDKMLIIKCDGLRGLEAAVAGPIAALVRSFDGYQEFLKNELEAARQGTADVNDRMSREILEIKKRHEAELKAAKKSLEAARRKRDKMKVDLVAANWDNVR